MNSGTGAVENELSARPNEHPLKSVAFELRVFCLCNASVRAPRGSVTLGPACKSKGDLGGPLLTSLLLPQLPCQDAPEKQQQEFSYDTAHVEISKEIYHFLLIYTSIHSDT